MKNKNFISTVEATKIANVTKVTIIDWCKKHKIGEKVIGRWRVDPDKLNNLLSGEVNDKKESIKKESSKKKVSKRSKRKSKKAQK